jgi:hypothetical protein
LFVFIGKEIILMDKLTEKYLRRIISESYISDVEEMAYKQKGVRDDKGKMVKYKPFFKEDNDTDIPDYWVANPSLQPGAEILVVPLDCQELEDFKNANKEWLDSIQALHNLEPQLAACKRGKYHRPIEKYVEGGYKPTGESYSEKENIKRALYPIIAQTFESESFAEVLNARSIPAIVARDRKNVNQYGEYSNTKIEYQTHNNNSYETVKDFLTAAVARVNNRETPDMKTYYLARQYNNNYNRWRADKKMLKQYAGKTPKYELDAFGLEEGNYDTTVRMDFEIFGQPVGDNSYTWNVRMRTNLGKKLSEESGLRNGWLDDKLIQSTTTAQFRPGTEFNEKYTVMDNPEIRNALIEAIDDLKSKVEAINPKETLRAATVKRYQIGNRGDELNESIKKKLVQRVVQKVIK